MRVSRLPLHAVVGTGRLTWLATSRTAGRRPARTMPVQAFTKASVKRLRPGVLRTAPGNGALVGAGFLSPAWPPSRRRRRHGWRHPRRRHALQSRRGLRLAPALHAHERGPRRRRAAARGPHRELCGHGPGRAPGGGGGARRLGAGRTAAVGVLNTRLYLPDGSGARPDRRGLRPRPLPGHGDHGRCPWPHVTSDFNSTLLVWSGTETSLVVHGHGREPSSRRPARPPAAPLLRHGSAEWWKSRRPARVAVGPGVTPVSPCRPS